MGKIIGIDLGTLMSLILKRGIEKKNIMSKVLT